MTREEAIQIFLDRGWIKLENGTYFDGSKWREAIMVISDYFRNEYKALEQEPILDKIRAEILQLDYDLGSVDYDRNDMAQTEEVHMICREEVLQIIDKYKSESEDK